jgi:hypothetical protein
VLFCNRGIILPIGDLTRGSGTLVRYSDAHTITVRIDAEPRFVSITFQPETEIGHSFVRLANGGFDPAGEPNPYLQGIDGAGYKRRILVPVDHPSDLMRQTIRVIQEGQVFELESDCGPCEIDSATQLLTGVNHVAHCLQGTDWA